MKVYQYNMKDFIKNYSKWKFILESEEEAPSDEVKPSISSKIIKGIKSEVINNRLIKRINGAIGDAIKDYKGKVYTVPGTEVKNIIGTINISHGIRDAVIKSLTSTNDDGSEGKIIGKIRGWALIKGNELDDYLEKKDRTIYVSCELTATYKIDVETDKFTYKITSVRPYAKKKFEGAFFRLLPIEVKISGDKLSVKDIKTGKNIIDGLNVGISNHINGKSGSFDLDQALANI